MVAAKPDSTRQPHASSATSASPPSAEEESLKRNTDCVYFLASPLTCKKGSECEYRHSDYARVNPRDCYYWLSGNCLNPKCPFRHPPLDALLGTQPVTAAAPLKASVSMPPAVHLPAPASYGSAKEAVPCIFFQKGYCMKGDLCSFSHGTNPVVNKLQQPPVPVPSTELPYKKPSGILRRCSQQQKTTPSFPKPQSASKPLLDSGKHASVARSLNEETLQYEASFVNGRSIRSKHPLSQDDESIQHGREAEELLRESSPGFDVLVDDELGDADYYHGEDQYGTHEQQQYNIDRPVDYPSLLDPDPLLVSWEQRRNPSDQMVAYAQSESPHIDLRQHLKHRRINGGLRSVVISDFVPEGSSFNERRQRVPPKETAGGGRLKGRLKFPERFGANGNGFLHHDRLRGRIHESYNSEDRGILGHPPNKGSKTSFPGQLEGGDVSFEGPKPLSVLLKRKRGTTESRASKPEHDDSSPQIKEEGEEEQTEIADAQMVEGDDYEYEQVDGEYTYEGVNAEEEDDYLADEDDDFAKKVGVMYS